MQRLCGIGTYRKDVAMQRLCGTGMYRKDVAVLRLYLKADCVA